MKFKNRYNEVAKRIINDKVLFAECSDFEELNEEIKEWDTEIQDISHEIEKDNAKHEIRKELKIELRRFARKEIIKIWKKHNPTMTTMVKRKIKINNINGSPLGIRKYQIEGNGKNIIVSATSQTEAIKIGKIPYKEIDSMISFSEKYGEIKIK